MTLRSLASMAVRTRFRPFGGAGFFSSYSHPDENVSRMRAFFSKGVTTEYGLGPYRIVRICKLCWVNFERNLPGFFYPILPGPGQVDTSVERPSAPLG
jgi:hypothetical protein